MQTLWQDLRYGARMLLKNPGFTLIAVLTLALGIGANTAIFSVVYGVLLKPLPYKDAERVVIAGISPPDFRDVQAASQSFDRMALWASNLYNVTQGGETTQVRGAIVTPDLLPMLTEPALGRFWRAEEDTQHLAVISHDYWQSSFGGDANVIGQTIRLYGKPHTIVGVTPPEFQYPSRDFKIWNSFGAAMAEAPQQMENRQFRIFRAVAHLKPGVSLTRMQAEIETISQRLRQQYPDTNSGVRINFTSLYERLVGDVSRALWVLLATVGFVLLIACANVANLTLARMAVREREIAIRTALGAGRARLLRQLLTESLLLAVIGGAAGLLLAVWGLDALVTFNPDNIPRLIEVRLNAPVLMFTLGAVILTGLIFGLVPAWQAARGNLNQTLREGGRGAFGNVKGRRLRGALVVAEIALSLIVLAGAGLLLKSFHRLLNVEAGFKAENLLTVNLPLVEFRDAQQRASVVREVFTRIAQIPGVQTVSGGSALPPVNAQRATRFAAQGLPVSDGSARTAYFIAVSPDYFRALGTPLLAGRDFTEAETQSTPRTVIINDAFAREYFRDANPLGQRLIIDLGQALTCEIVGVASDTKQFSLQGRTQPAIYLPSIQAGFSALIVQTPGDPLVLVPAMREAVRAVDKDQPIANVRSMDQILSRSVAEQHFRMLLLSMFAVVALGLSGVGIYGVMSLVSTQVSSNSSRLCRLMCGRSSTFRKPVSSCGAMPQRVVFHRGP